MSIATTGTYFGDRAVSRLAVSVATVAYLVGYLGYGFREQLDPARYFVYVIPGILVGSLLLQSTPKINEPAAGYVISYLTLTFVACLAGIVDMGFFWNDVIIMTFIGLCFVPSIYVGADQIRTIFLGSLACFLLKWLLTDHGGIRILELLAAGTGSGLGSGYDDHQGGLLSPIYAVFFYAVGAKIQFVLALILTVLGGKRVAILALIIGLASIFFFRRIGAFERRRDRFFALLGGLATINIVALNLDDIIRYVHGALDIRVHIETIMLGRYKIASEMVRVIENRSLFESLFGFGPGSANALAWVVSAGSLDLPHNDWLKLLYNHGILGSMMFTLFMALVFSSSMPASVIALASAVIMSTDNVIVYLYYQFPMVMMVACCSSQGSPRQEAAQIPHSAGVAK